MIGVAMAVNAGRNMDSKGLFPGPGLSQIETCQKRQAA